MTQCTIQLVLWVSQARVWAPNWIMMAVTLPRAGRENRNPPSHQEVSSCRHDFDGGLNPYCVDPNLINFENLYSNNHWLRSSKDECSTGGDQTIILGLHIFLDHRSLSSIGQKILMILFPFSILLEVVWMFFESYSSYFCFFLPFLSICLS